MKRRILSGLLILLFMQTFAWAAVRPVPTRTYPTIQSAIDAANPGDIVVVAPGVYTGFGNVDLDFNGKAITVQSQINPSNPDPSIIAATIIDCGGNRYLPHRAFHFHSGEGPDSKLLGFTIRNGYMTDAIGADGQYRAGTPNPFELTDPNGDPNTTPPIAERGESIVGDGYGGAILCDGASPTIRYCVITNNTVTGGQGGDGAGGQFGNWVWQPVIPPVDPNRDPNLPPLVPPPPQNTDDGQWGGAGGDGNGYGYGGAIACIDGSNPNISDCTISNNIARGGSGGTGGDGGFGTGGGRGSHGGDGGTGMGDGMGGAIYCKNGSSPTVERCTFSNNIATQGLRGDRGLQGQGNALDPPLGPATDGSYGGSISYGGIAGGAVYYIDNSHPNFIDCTFTDNEAYGVQFSPDPYGQDIPSYAKGGALYSGAGITVTLDNCDFTGSLGGAVYCESGCSLDFDDCLFEDNSETAMGGAIYNANNGNVDLRNCIFKANSAYSDGGALNCKSNATIADCSFSGNIAGGDGGAIFAYDRGTTLVLDINNCDFAGNQGVWGGGFFSENFIATFTDCYFLSNTAESGGGLSLADGAVFITNSTISLNSATDYDGSGGGLDCINTAAEIVDCTIVGNSADGGNGFGGAICFYGGDGGDNIRHVVKNCLITDNSAADGGDGYGGAISCNFFVTPEIQNCTFSRNSASSYGGAIFQDWSSFIGTTQIADSIFDNCSSHAIYEEYYSEINVRNCLFYDNPDGHYYDADTGQTYTTAAQINAVSGNQNNIEDDPLFVDGPLGSFYLSQIAAGQAANSPAVDNGSDTAANIGLDTYTTRIDNVFDVPNSNVDIGYHYSDSTGLGWFSLTVTVTGGRGTVEPVSGTYFEGAFVSITATPSAGYNGVVWSGGTIDDSSTAFTNSVIIDSDKNIFVEFQQVRTLIVAVGGGEPGYYSNIQEAVNAARNGDTIVVYPGTYYRPEYGVQVNKSVLITSRFPDDDASVASTIIDGSGYGGPDFYLLPGTDENTVINGFTFANSQWYIATSRDGSRQNPNHPDGWDGGCAEAGIIYIYSGAVGVFKNCIIRDNLCRGGDGGDGVGADFNAGFNAGRGGWGGWARGGGVYCEPYSTVTFINCQIIDNEVHGADGGDGGDPDVPALGNYGGNWSKSGAPGLPALDIDSYSLTVNFVTDANLWEVMEWDLALLYWWYDTSLDGHFAGDYRWYSGYGGGIYCDIGSTVTFIDCIISGNRTYGGMSGEGGGAASNHTPPQDPYEIPTFGAGVYCAEDTTVTFTGCTIADNRTVGPQLIDVNDPNLGSRYHIDPYLGHGGGVCAEDSAVVTFTDCAFSNNEATVGGGIHWANSNPTFTDCNFVSNEAYQGGGMFGLHGPVSIIDCSFISNEAVSDINKPDPNLFEGTLGAGGGLHLWATDANILGCELSYNRADASGGGIYFGGENDSSMINCLVANNRAGRDGGGVSVNWYCPLTIANCTIADNVLTGAGFAATYGGGLYCSYEGNTEVIDSILWGNTADYGPQIAIYTGYEYDERPSDVNVSYSNVQGGEAAVFVDTGCTLEWDVLNNILGDPLFVNGPLGNYYLSQVAAGQSVDSPAVDNGSDISVNLGLSAHTTRIDGIVDEGWVDLGYHYGDHSGLERFSLTVTIIEGQGTVAVEPTAVTYYEGTVVVITVIPGPGYTAINWSGGTVDDSSTAFTNSVVMDSDKNIFVRLEQPRTFHVGPNGDYSGIQDAIHDAQDGDTIVVDAGVYYGPGIQLNKSITIASKNPDDPCSVAATIIDLTGYANRAFWLGPDTDANTVIDGLTIQNSRWFVLDGEDGSDPCDNGGDGREALGGAIYIFSGASPVIKNCVIRNNWIRGGHGGDGVGADETHNAGRGGWGAFARGGAIYCAPDSSPTFINCQIINNTVRGGDGGDGGDAVQDGGTANYGGNWSRAEWFDVRPESLEIRWVEGDLWEAWQRTIRQGGTAIPGGSYIGDYRWYSGYGGGVYCDIGSTVNFIDCTISGNRSEGGMSGEGGDRPGNDPEPETSYEIPSFGGGVYCAANTTVTFAGCTITNNISSEPEYIDANDPNLGVRYHLNPYLGHGGGVCAEGSARVIFTDRYVLGSGNRVITTDNCVFGGNVAAVGGGIYWDNANPMIINCDFISNSAHRGGGVLGIDGPATIIGCSFIGNEAALDIFNVVDPNADEMLGEGGGLHLWAADANVIDCEFSYNLADASGGGIYFGGENDSLLTNCLVANNTAGRDGGGVSVNWYCPLTISNCTIAGNVLTGVGFAATYGGGLYSSYESDTEVINSILWGNSADYGPQIAIYTGFEYDKRPAEVSVTYSDVQDGAPGVFVDTGCTLYWDDLNNLTGTSNSNPLFVSGYLGDYYLSQPYVVPPDPSQTELSPCVDVGSDNADALGMYKHTTRTDMVIDAGTVDMGYHYVLITDLAGDFNFDGYVDCSFDSDDFYRYISHWLESCDLPDWCEGTDVNRDGIVNLVDYAAFIGNCGASEGIPPEPDPMTWAAVPQSAAGQSWISMTATMALDNSGYPVKYYFDCFFGNCSDSGWQSDPCYIDTGLAANTEYGYRVKARDTNQNETDWSFVGYAIVGEGITPPSPDPMTWATVPYATSPNSIAMVATTATGAGGIEYYFDETSGEPNGTDSGWQSSPIYVDVNLDPNTTYTYRVNARDENGRETGWSSELPATTFTWPPPPPLTAPLIVSSRQYDDGIYWHHEIVASTTSSTGIYYRFVCVEEGGFNSAWELRTGTGGPIPSGAGDITYGSGIITYDVIVRQGGSPLYRSWKVCASDNPGVGPEECSDTVIPMP